MNDPKGKGKKKTEIYYRLIIANLPPALRTGLSTCYPTPSTFHPTRSLPLILLLVIVIDPREIPDGEVEP